MVASASYIFERAPAKLRNCSESGFRVFSGFISVGESILCMEI